MTAILRRILAALSPRLPVSLDDHAPRCRGHARLEALADRDRDDVVDDLDGHAEQLLATGDIPCLCR